MILVVTNKGGHYAVSFDAEGRQLGTFEIPRDIPDGKYPDDAPRWWKNTRRVQNKTR